MIDCRRRKLKPGTLHDAAKQHNIDLTQSLMIGDSEVDMLAGKGAGCTCVLIKNANDASLFADSIEYIDYKAKDLLETAQRILVSNTTNNSKLRMKCLLIKFGSNYSIFAGLEMPLF